LLHLELKTRLFGMLRLPTRMQHEHAAVGKTTTKPEL